MHLSITGYVFSCGMRNGQFIAGFALAGFALAVLASPGFGEDYAVILNGLPPLRVKNATGYTRMFEMPGLEPVLAETLARLVPPPSLPAPVPTFPAVPG